MSDATTIAAYLRRLDEELRLKRAPRQRLLAEAEDHLRSVVEELVGEGRASDDAEREAVARFGAAAQVARRFAHAAASSTARAAVAWGGAAFCAYTLAAGLFLLSAPGWLRDFPQGAPSLLALQVAAVALAVTSVRALHWRRTPVVDERRLHLIANGALIAGSAVVAGALAETLLALARPAPAPWADASALIAAFGLAVVVCTPAALIATAAFARTNGLGALAGRRVVRDLTFADDIAAAAPILGGLARAVFSRPGWTCAAVAGSAFATLAVGDPVVAVFEAAAIVAGFLLLARPLGLR